MTDEWIDEDIQNMDLLPAENQNSWQRALN
jgi:hypothetical protein